MYSEVHLQATGRKRLEIFKKQDFYEQTEGEGKTKVTDLSVSLIKRQECGHQRERPADS